MVACVEGGGVEIGGVPVPPPPQELIPRIRTAIQPICQRCLRFLFNEIAVANIMPKTIGKPRKGNSRNAALAEVTTVTVTGPPLTVGVSVIDVGLTEQVVPTGAPEQVRATTPLNVLGELKVPNVRLYVAVCPATTVAVVVPWKEKGGTTFTTCTGETAAL